MGAAILNSNQLARFVTSSSGNTGLGGADGTFTPIGMNLKIIGESKITKAKAALAQSTYRRVNIAVHSHSIGIGVSANDGTTYDATNMELWATQSQYAVLSKILSSSFGGISSSSSQSVCSGSASPRTTNPLFTVGGGASAASSNEALGPGGWRIALTAPAHTVQLVAKGSSIKVYGIAGAPGTQAIWSAPSVAAGANQTAAACGSDSLAAAAVYWYEWTITGVTAGEVVTLKGPASGVYTIYAIDADYRTDAGITVHRWCLTGAPLVEINAASMDSTDTAGPIAGWIGATTLVNNTRADNAASMATRHGFDFVICQTDVNDLNTYDAVGSAWGYTLADHKRHLANYLSYHATNGIPVLVVFGPIRDPSYLVGARPYDQAQLISTLKEAVDESTMAAYIDLTTQFSGSSLTDRYNAQVAAGVMNPDEATVHPGKLGHAFFGNQLATLLMDGKL